jgi:L-lactate dehydrogenase (cytochrome)
MRPYMVKPVTALDYRRLAKKRLPRFLFDYIDGGANQETSMAANRITDITPDLIERQR